MVFSTLHTNDAVSTPVRLLDMGAPRYMVALSLQLVIAQRLLRVICESCIEDYQPLPGEHEWLRSELGDRVDQSKYKLGRGCSHCNGTGFVGRTGVYEMLEMTKPVVEAANNDDVRQFMKVAREQIGSRTLRHHAAELAASGKTSPNEAMRVSSQLAD
jgi:MSHA biogenesis protein MshE